MAIAFDATSKSGTAEGTNPSWSHTCTGDDRVLVVIVTVRFSGDAPASVTYNGVGMTKQREVTRAESAFGDVSLSIWTLANPAAGTNTIAFTATLAWGMGASYTGCDTADPVGGTGENTGTSASPSVSITTDADNSYVVAGYVGNGNTGATGDGLTDRNGQLFNPPNSYGTIGDKAVASAGATTADWDSTNAIYNAVAVELHEVAAGGAVKIPRRMVLGIG